MSVPTVKLTDCPPKTEDKLVIVIVTPHSPAKTITVERQNTRHSAVIVVLVQHHRSISLCDVRHRSRRLTVVAALDSGTRSPVAHSINGGSTTPERHRSVAVRRRVVPCHLCILHCGRRSRRYTAYY